MRNISFHWLLLFLLGALFLVSCSKEFLIRRDLYAGSKTLEVLVKIITNITCLTSQTFTANEDTMPFIWSFCTLFYILL